MEIPNPSLPSELADLKQRVLAAARDEPAPTRRAAAVQVAVLVVAAGCLVAYGFHARGGVHWAAARPVPFLIGVALGWGLVAVGISFIALRRGRSMLGRSRNGLLGFVLATPPALFGWSLLWNTLYPASLKATPGRVGLACLDLALTIGALPVLVLVLARRNTDPVHPAVTGAALGAAVGTWSALTMDLSCECTNPSHVALGHVLPVVLLIGFGAWMGQRLIAIRR
jgi:hypothetical protein